MKKVIMAALLLVGTIGFAQEKQDTKQKRERVEMSAEQKTDLRLKKLTLELDLNASQQKEMKKILEEQQAKRTATAAKMKEKRASKTKPTADELYAMRSQRLDAQIEQKAKMKKLLSEEQFAKWEKMGNDRKEHFKKGDKPMRHKRPERQPEQKK